jgi:TIR domain/FHA domain
MSASDVFICHSSLDKDVADAVCAVLERNGIRCWIAPRDVMPGNYGESILDGIEGSHGVVLVFTGNANQSGPVSWEIERAVSKGRWLIPIRFENVLPSRKLELFVSSSHWLDACTPPVEQHLELLATAIRGLLPPDSSRAASPPRRSAPPPDQPSAESNFRIHRDVRNPSAGFNIPPPAMDHGRSDTTGVPTLLIANNNSRVALRPGANTVGRHPQCDVVLNEASVSPRHAEIRWEQAEILCLLSDLNSDYGTLVNNAPVMEWQLADGDVLQFGDCTCHFSYRP